MRKILLVASALSLMLFAGQASAMTYYLKKDMGIRNNQHLCLYANNKVYSFNATDLCDTYVQDDGPPDADQESTQNGQRAMQPVRQTGFKAGEYQDGMTKVCIYNVLGRREGIRIGNAELCPLSHEF